MKHSYICEGTCSKRIEFSIENGMLHDVKFQGGCAGNTQGLSSLLEGMPAADAAKRLKGIRCGSKPTSCPDQLSRAILAAID